MTTEFSQLDLHPGLVQRVTDLGYTAPTPIQTAVIPLMLAGRDVIGQAQTGTGKTAAFALPILQNLEPAQHHVQALVLVPTRELAQQVAQAIHEYGSCRTVRVLPVYGGQPYSRQISRLKRGVDIVVGTPGRLLDLLERGVLDISRVSTVVLDEADEMLSMGFIEDIQVILGKTPSERQNALFSATISKEIRNLADQYMHSPQSVTIKSKQLTVDTVDHRYCLVNKEDKLAVLTRLFEVQDISRALVFVSTRVGSSDLVNELMGRGFPAEALNGDLNQQTREQVLNRFRRNQNKVLVATDVAARGLDIDDISHVFNFDLPHDPELYVHRVGRTGRAGKAGVAISLSTPREQWRLRRIETFCKQRIKRIAIPATKDIAEHRETQTLEQFAVWLKRGRCQRERDIVMGLIEAGYDPIQIAAIALKAARSGDNQRPIEPIGEVKEGRPLKSKVAFKRGPKRNGRHGSDAAAREAGMVRLTLSAGKSNGIRPRDVVGTIAAVADIPGSTIGAIRIMEKHTLVDVPQEYVAKTLARAGKYRIRKNAVTLVRA